MSKEENGLREKDREGNTNLGSNDKYSAVKFMNRHSKQINTVYTCNHPGCGVTFQKLGNIKNHVLTHSNDKPFACEICGNQYTQKGNLTKHIIQVHDYRPILDGKPSRQQVHDYHRLKKEVKQRFKLD